MDEKLIEAAEYIEGHFTTGQLMDDEGNVCLLGALGKVHGVDEWTIPHQMAYNNLTSVIPECGCPRDIDGDRVGGLNDIAHYNDMHCAGGIEAAKLLREAAERDEEL